MKIPFEETKYGYKYGAAKIERCFSDENKGWVVLSLETPKFKGCNSIQIYVTKTGKVAVSTSKERFTPKRVK